MKRFLSSLLVLAVASAFAQSTDSRVLFTVGGEKVTVADFEYVYNKNNINNQSDYSEKSLKDYLNLYENFRLKVKEAEAMHLDTISSLKTELEGYRKQLAKSYLTDREISDKLIEEAYNRSRTDVNASHILVKLDENANPADTLAAYKKIMGLKKRLDKGESFEKVAKENSEDPSAKSNEGNIGWFTVFGTIYPFETVAYSLKPGEVSGPVRTEFGYHLVKLNATREARGQIHTAHVLVRFPENATPTEKDAVKKKIDSIYSLVSSGKLSFDDAVHNFSDDKASRAKGGELQWFGSGSPIRMVPEFEDAAFALKKDGDISKPIQSQFGWHIIKRLEKREMPSFADAKNDIKKKVERDTRSQVAKNKLIERIKKENAFAENLAAKAELSAKIDSTLSKGNWKSDSLLKASGNKMLFSLAGKTYTQADFLDYVEKVAKRRSDKNKEGLINEYYEGFVNQKALDYEESTLEAKKPDFRNLMKEYRDGILLFELMDRQVWTKSVKDTTGLEEYRQKNATKYMWGDRADVVIYNVNDAKLAAAANKLAKKGTDAAAIKTKLNKADAKARISTIEGKYEKGQYDVVDKVKWEAGVTDVEKLNDSSYRFVVVKKIVGPEPKSLKEAKGYITSDYQEYLEKTWLASLRNKYPIVVDPAVFKSLIKK